MNASLCLFRGTGYINKSGEVQTQKKYQKSEYIIKTSVICTISHWFVVTVRNTINGLFFSNNQILPVLLLILYIEQDYRTLWRKCKPQVFITGSRSQLSNYMKYTGVDSDLYTADSLHWSTYKLQVLLVLDNWDKGNWPSPLNFL